MDPLQRSPGRRRPDVGRGGGAAWAARPEPKPPTVTGQSPEPPRPRSRPTPWASPRRSAAGGTAPPAWDAATVADHVVKGLGKLLKPTSAATERPPLRGHVRTFRPFAQQGASRRGDNDRRDDDGD